MRETDTHIYFWGSFLSNFYWTTIKANFSFPLYSEEVEFHSSEQYYMALKAQYFGDFTSVSKIIMAPDAKSAKAFGRKVIGFDAKEWYEISRSKMYQAVLAKFEQNLFLREKLLETGIKTLVEASPIDNIWGVGLHSDDDAILDSSNWTGENRLGQVLMDTRFVLRITKDMETMLGESN
ncbi:MAG: NADAR family protein [Legionella sp.]|uniref:NADAR family protein n=1 Tax=Legionella sp. TaxID=459 RepID=UPI00284740E1|nr:NADAR family protein [Legionella sp.]